jgi:hypothetical protein
MASTGYGRERRGLQGKPRLGMKVFCVLKITFDTWILPDYVT